MSTTLDHDLTGVLGEVANILIDLEADQHRRGWDQHPLMLHCILRHHDREYGVGSLELGGDSATLAQFADAIEQPINRRQFRELYHHPPVAHAVTSEVWQNNQLSHDERAGRALADIPGSVEARLVVGVVGASQLLVRRARGQEPTVDHEDGTSGAAMVGPMMDALHRIQRAARTVYGSHHV